MRLYLKCFKLNWIKCTTISDYEKNKGTCIPYSNLMKKELLALLLLCILNHFAYAQGTIVSVYSNENTNKKDKNNNAIANLLQQKIKQIINKSIHYNYYLGDDLYTEKSFISDAAVTYNNNKLEIYFYITTQKYDLHSSAMFHSEHGESVSFDPTSIKDVSIKGKYTDYSKSELGLLVINFDTEVEKHTYIQKKKNEDPALLDNPLVYEFELPFLKADNSNPKAIQDALMDLKKSNREGN